MTEYIEKSKIIEALENQKNKFAFVSADVLIDAIKEMESAVVIDELIRCKDCKYWGAGGCYVDGIYNKNGYRCLHTDICKNAIKLFAKSKGIKIEEEPQEDDWMEDQAL